MNKPNVLETNIIPHKNTFYRVAEGNEIDYKAIAFFTATGFFLGDSSYFKNIKCMEATSVYALQENNYYKKIKSNFSWHYSPRDISLNVAVEELAELMQKIVDEKLKDKNIILPLSGGLDSRSQATALKGLDNVVSYSYKFADSFDESFYGRKIAEKYKWKFHDLVVPKGYLWNSISELANINQCYSDFTHPRQMAFMDLYPKMGDVFYLGHWGDVLFDGMGVSEDASSDELVDILKHKIIKKGGLELGKLLWNSWGLSGDFETELNLLLSQQLEGIKIDNNNARIRAFKSLYWAPRWTSVNLNLFAEKADLVLPYYDNRMCELVCSIPENILDKRQVQIEYIKKYSPELAEIPWQTYSPLNLYTYKNYFSASNLPNRIKRKVSNKIKNVFGAKNNVIRNWEIQFVGEKNDENLKNHLFNNELFKEFVDPKIVNEIYDKFKQTDSVYFSHPLSMLLTLSEFVKIKDKQINNVIY